MVSIICHQLFCPSSTWCFQVSSVRNTKPSTRKAACVKLFSHQLCESVAWKEGGWCTLMSTTVFLRAWNALAISDTRNYAIWKLLLGQRQMSLSPACKPCCVSLDRHNKAVPRSSIKTNDSSNASVSCVLTARWKMWSSLLDVMIWQRSARMSILLFQNRYTMLNLEFSL